MYIKLFKPENTIYRSASLRRFIDDHDFRPFVDKLAHRMQEAELPPLPAQN
jgi:hypothetical protein